MNDGNLIPFGQRTESEQRELARRGGIASGAARRERKRIRELVTEMLAAESPSGKTYAELLAVNLVKDAVGGDLRAVKLVLDLEAEHDAAAVTLQVTQTAQTAIEISQPIQALLDSIHRPQGLQIGL